MNGFFHVVRDQHDGMPFLFEDAQQFRAHAQVQQETGSNAKLEARLTALRQLQEHVHAVLEFTEAKEGLHARAGV